MPEAGRIRTPSTPWAESGILGGEEDGVDGQNHGFV